MIETIILCALFGAFIMLSFMFGVKVGQMTKLGEKVEIKTPTRVIKEYKEKKNIEEAGRKENELIETMLQNIDSYDGTAIGQIDLDRK